jgi:hypothetical protein
MDTEEHWLAQKLIQAQEASPNKAFAKVSLMLSKKTHQLVVQNTEKEKKKEAEAKKPDVDDHHFDDGTKGLSDIRGKTASQKSCA